MSQLYLDYAHPTLFGGIRPSTLLFWISISLLTITVAVFALPSFGPFYVGSPVLIVARSAQFVVFYGKWIVTAFALIAIPSQWYLRRSDGRVRAAVCIAVA